MPNHGSLEAAGLGFDMPISTLEEMRFIKHKSSVLKSMNGFQHINDGFVEGKYLRQLVKGEVDPAGTDISGFFVLADGGAAFLYKDVCGAQHWANNPKYVNKESAPNLTYIESGNPNMSLVELSKIFTLIFLWY